MKQLIKGISAQLQGAHRCTARRRLSGTRWTLLLAAASSASPDTVSFDAMVLHYSSSLGI
jgi:hypothetical protein